MMMTRSKLKRVYVSMMLVLLTVFVGNLRAAGPCTTAQTNRCKRACEGIGFEFVGCYINEYGSPGCACS